MAFYSYLSTKIIMAFITKSYQNLFGVRSYINAKLNPAETIFVDDGAANIVIGKELGFITMQPENGEDWRQKLEKLL